jgi:lipopolysaccharide export LptBFGC system permease protein LptF
VSFFLSLAFHREFTTRLVSTAIAGSIVCSALVFVLVMEVVPALNTISRVRVFQTLRTTHPSANLQPGLSEMRLGALNDRIANPASVRQGSAAHAHRQERFAFVALIPVVGLLGLALAGRWQSRAVTVVAAVGVFTLYGASLGLARELVTRGSPAPVWTANAVLLGLGIWTLRVRHSP